MGPVPDRLAKIVLIICFLCLASSTIACADDAPSIPTAAEKWIQKIEERSGGWIAFRADLEMMFTAGDEQPAATCHGEMFYDRFRERLRLDCKDDRGEMLFTFKAFDQNFELSLKDTGTVYRGDIFEPEISAEIENHLAPLELYRAVKLSAIPEKNTEIESEDPQSVTLRVVSEKDNVRYTSRRITSLPNGDVPLEIWFSSKSVPLATISRHEYRRVEDKARIQDAPVHLPYQIQLVTQKDLDAPKNETLIVFKRITLLDRINENTWE
jgi:hypothetical protein